MTAEPTVEMSPPDFVLFALNGGPRTPRQVAAFLAAQGAPSWVASSANALGLLRHLDDQGLAKDTPLGWRLTASGVARCLELQRHVAALERV